MSPMCDAGGNALADLKVGDRVQVFDVNRRPLRDGFDGTVVKVGRTLITVRYGHGYTKVFRLDSGRANDAFGHQWIETPAQMAEDARRDELVQRLRDSGLEVRMGRQLPTQTLEAVAAALDEAESRRAQMSEEKP